MVSAAAAAGWHQLHQHLPELPPHHPTPAQQRAYRTALKELQQLQDDFHAAHGEKLAAGAAPPVPPSPHRSTVHQRERALHEAERITLQMTRHWRHMRARGRAAAAQERAERYDRPVSPPAGARRPQEATGGAASASDNPYLPPRAAQLAQWEQALAEKQERMDALEAELVSRGQQGVQPADVDAVASAAIDAVVAAFTAAARPAVAAWQAQVAETEDRLSLDLDVLRDANLALQSEVLSLRQREAPVRHEDARVVADSSRGGEAESGADDHKPPADEPAADEVPCDTQRDEVGEEVTQIEERLSLDIDVLRARNHQLEEAITQREEQLEQREEQLEQREAAITQREEQLGQREAAVAAAAKRCIVDTARLRERERCALDSLHSAA